MRGALSVALSVVLCHLFSLTLGSSFLCCVVYRAYLTPVQLLGPSSLFCSVLRVSCVCVGRVRFPSSVHEGTQCSLQESGNK